MTNIGQVADLAQLADKLAIQEIIALHSRGVDRRDEAALLAAYWPDAEVDYGSYKGPAHDFATLLGPALDAQYQLTQHNVCNTIVSLAADEARAESYVTARHLALDGKTEMEFSGRYLDVLQRRNGEWKLLHRQVVLDWTKEHVVEDATGGDAFSALAKGSRNELDPLYGFIGASLNG